MLTPVLGPEGDTKSQFGEAQPILKISWSLSLQISTSLFIPLFKPA
jgi:hypothetical protein